MSSDPDASKCYDPTADKYYYGYGCTIIPVELRIPIAAGLIKSEVKQTARSGLLNKVIEHLVNDMFDIGKKVINLLC
jgi:hypothetical protein